MSFELSINVPFRENVDSPTLEDDLKACIDKLGGQFANGGKSSISILNVSLFNSGDSDEIIEEITEFLISQNIPSAAFNGEHVEFDLPAMEIPVVEHAKVENVADQEEYNVPPAEIEAEEELIEDLPDDKPEKIPADEEAVEYAGGTDDVEVIETPDEEPAIEDVMPEEINSVEEPDTADGAETEGEDIPEDEESKE